MGSPQLIMADGEDTRYHPKRRIVRIIRDPFEEQRQYNSQSRSYGPVRSRSEEQRREIDAAYLYNQYFDGESDN